MNDVAKPFALDYFLTTGETHSEIIQVFILALIQRGNWLTRSVGGDSGEH